MLKTWAVAAAAGAMLAASAANAQAVHVTSVDFTPGYVVGNIHSPALNATVGVGQFEFKGNFVSGGAPFDYFTYCVDLAHTVSLGSVNYSYTIQSLSSLTTNTTKANALNALLTHTSALLGAATGQNAINISAATQMAVWEIMFETQASSNWSVTSSTGALYLDTGSGGSNLLAAENLANGYLGNIATNAWSTNSNFQVKYLYSSSQQSQVFLAAVPEPATWGMMIVGFGVIGAGLRRRRAQVLAAA